MIGYKVSITLSHNVKQKGLSENIFFILDFQDRLRKGLTQMTKIYY